jgi:hypothetical protein
MKITGHAGFGVTILAALAVSVCADIDRDNVVGLWLFEEGEGTVVNDSSGQGNHGTFNGGVQWAEGIFGTAVNCGAKGHVLVKDSDSLDLDKAWTLTLWVKINPPMERWQTILNKRFDIATNYVIRLQDVGKWEVMVNNGGWVRVGDPSPAQGGEWVHLAGTYDGTSNLTLFVDGQQVATRSGVRPPPVNNIDLRLGNYSGNSGGIDGMMDETAIFNVALPPEDIRRIREEGLATALNLSGAGFAKARSPDPKDGAVLETTAATLTWKPGGFAVTHDVYVGTERAAVEEATPGSDLFAGTTNVMQLPVGVTGRPFPEGLTPGTTYYWRVDEVNDLNAASPWQGDVWSFMVRPLTAWNPIPADTTKFVGVNGDLSWQAGLGAAFHTVYLGEDPEEVRNATTGGVMAVEPTHDPGLLKPGTTYYWRIDEFAFPENVTRQGAVWSFTTLAPGGGVKAQYFSGIDLLGEPVLTRTEDAVDHNWTGEIVAGLSDQVSARWTADLEAPLADTYKLITTSDDGVRLWLDGRLLIDNWTNHAAADNTATVSLKAGEIYSIRMEWYEDTGSAVAQLSWQGPSMPRQIIPGGALQPPLRAGMPAPANGALDAPQAATLSWSAGDGATQHHLYFGDDAATVAQAGTPTVQQASDKTTYDAGAPEWGKTYYWRVDEQQADGTVLAGKVWSFTTADYAVVDDFESYTDDEGSRIYETWIDGWTNSTGSTVGYIEAPFAERKIVHGGAQSMPLDYNNIHSPFYSEGERTFSPVQDWTTNGVNTLSLFWRGDAANGPGKLYVALEDSSGKVAVVANDAALTATAWTQWQVPLSQFTGVNLGRVKVLYLGVGDRNTPAEGGAGGLYFDDIRVRKL